MKGAIHSLPLSPGATLGKAKKKRALSLANMTASGNAGKTKKGGFADILRSKLDSAAMDRMRKSGETTIGLLKETNQAAASTLEKAFRKLMEDSSLSSRQKAARLKALIDTAAEKAALIPGRAQDTGAIGNRKLAAATEKKEAEPAALSSLSSKKAEKTKVFVLDLRKGSGEKTANQETPGDALKTSKDPGALPFGRAAEDRGQASARGTEIPSTRASTPAERLQDMTGSEFAKTAGIILRDGGGEIRLVLKPESLGSVRVRLNLTDNRVEGTFIVDNPAAKQVIEGNLDSIMQALSAEGFQTASLSVSVGGGNAGEKRQEDVPVVRRVESLSGFTGSLVDAVELPGWDELLVNLFA